MKHNHLLKLFFLVLSISILSQSQQTCAPQYILNNVLQDQVIIQPVSNGGLIEQTSNYFYPRTFFSATPKVIASFDNYQVDSFTEINYQLTVTVNRVSLDFTFKAENMEWSILRIKFWLTSRADILVGSFTLQNIDFFSSKTSEIAIPQQFSQFVDENIIQLNFITSIKATSPSNRYQVNVQNNGRAQGDSKFLVKVSSLGETSIKMIKVTYAIFNFKQSLFASGGGQLNYSPIQGAQFRKIHSSFAPIIYLIYGFDKIRLNDQNKFNLEYYIDEDYVMETYTGQVKIEELGVVYLSIGEQPSKVCGTCNQYIQTDACIDQCPPFKYPFVDYAEGGKTCLTCSAKLNETINEFSTGCICMDGFTRVDEECIPSGPVTECTGNNTVLSNGACVCVTGTQLINGVCTKQCQANQIYNQTSAQCECGFGYVRIDTLCGTCPAGRVYSAQFKACICPQNQFVNASTNLCACIPTFNRFEGVCVAVCPTGYKANSTTRVCMPSLNCSANSVQENGTCKCLTGFYKVGQLCTTCPASTYYNSTSLSCINCMANCNTCTNFTICQQCRQDYLFNGSACILNRTCTLPNQTLSNGACVCVNGTYRVNNTCTTCSQRTYYDAVNKKCQNCVFNCLSCTGGLSCLTCIPGLFYNSTLGYCAPPPDNCGTNQEVVNGTCQCINGTYKINGQCQACPTAHFYDQITKSCFPCLQNCAVCTSPSNCNRCIDFYFFNSTVGRCEPSNCPINQTIINGVCNCIQNTYKINGTCSVCQQREYYNATSQRCGQCPTNCLACGNAITCKTCQPNYKLSNNLCTYNLYDIVEGYPKFTQNNVITDFQTDRANNRPLTAQQLENIVDIQYEDGVPQPTATFLKQNPANISQIRIVQSYCGPIPINTYNTKYLFKDGFVDPNKTQTQNIRYSVLDNGLSDLSED